MNFLGRVRLARQKFIKYYEKGLADPDRFRPMSMYLYWSIIEEPGEPSYFDDDVLIVIDRAGSIYAPFSTIDEIMKRFDIAERLVKLWGFS